MCVFQGRKSTQPSQPKRVSNLKLQLTFDN